ncbi:hypothetical protein NKG94_07165 [Micromonospora sp. M12]
MGAEPGRIASPPDRRVRPPQRLVGRLVARRAVLAVTETDAHGQALLVDADTGRRRVLAEGDLLTLLDVTADAGTALLRRGPGTPAGWRCSTWPPATGGGCSRTPGGAAPTRAGSARTVRACWRAPTRSRNSPRWYGST